MQIQTHINTGAVLISFCLFRVFQRSCTQGEKASHSVKRGIGATNSEKLSPCSGGVVGFPLFGGGYSSALSQLEEGGFEQEDGAAEVTCM